MGVASAALEGLGGLAAKIGPDAAVAEGAIAKGSRLGGAAKLGGAAAAGGIGASLLGGSGGAGDSAFNRLGSTGAAARSSTSGSNASDTSGSLPPVVTASRVNVNDNMPTSRLLATAITLLSSIDSNLKSQIALQRAIYQNQSRSDREKNLEGGARSPNKSDNDNGKAFINTAVKSAVKLGLIEAGLGMAAAAAASIVHKHATTSTNKDRGVDDKALTGLDSALVASKYLKRGIGGARGIMHGGLLGAAGESIGYLTGDKKLTAKNLGVSAGGVAGGWGGAMAGAEFGAMAGSVVGPVGTVVGGIGGGVLGGIAGDQLGRGAAEKVADAVSSPAPSSNKPSAKPAAAGGPDSFRKVIGFIVDKLEGGSKLITDSGGLTKYGVSQKGNPNVDIKHLTRDGAIDIYKKKYWGAIKGIDKMSPEMQLMALDAAINAGPGRANQWAAQSKNNPAEFQKLRRAFNASLISRNAKKYKRYEKGWNNRLKNLETNGVAVATGKVAGPPASSGSEPISKPAATPAKARKAAAIPATAAIPVKAAMAAAPAPKSAIPKPDVFKYDPHFARDHSLKRNSEALNSRSSDKLDNKSLLAAIKSLVPSHSKSSPAPSQKSSSSSNPVVPDPSSPMNPHEYQIYFNTGMNK